MGSGQDWLQMDLGFQAGDRGEQFTMAQVMEALARGQSYLTSSRGRVVLLDEHTVEGVRDLLSETKARVDPSSGAYRVRGEQGLFLDSALDDLSGVRIAGEGRPSVILARGRQASVPLLPDLEKVLRPYQREGFEWLSFLRAQGLGGLLADEMGLGKTIQILALLASEYGQRETDTAGRGGGKQRLQPSLVVCPTSLVRNWEREAARFAPKLKVLVLHGPNRAGLYDELQDADLAITSYALLRRDLERLLDFEFEFLILDEAQHIKNRKTHNARSARSIRSRTRYVLTGTPVENSAGDLWSMMDFSLPGYLGQYKEFRERYELPMKSLDAEERGELGRRLGKRVRPFLLRRKKADVLADLPPKVEQIGSCALSDEQAELYRKLLDTSRKEVFDAVLSKGIGASRVVILTALMRLRQVCCHPALLPIEGVSEETPSGKLELFWELLNEALDSNHRILVFSQFVQMLKILRTHLDERDIRYCYLDGSTRDRLGEVDRFNGDTGIPLFLISLKAGGTGLNLASADTVIHFDPWWNPAVEDQATDRAHRIGQSRTVHTIRLVTEGTVEERILELQQRKRELAEILVEEGSGGPMDLSIEELEQLFSM
jgi:SNF2 family DNA or RNA helicase